ncbi:hypothetical protein P7K49_007134 [Saguinus oedipus]|uniref:Uncharacterized protein n=1 Tax=Saguinus oedipus TaxID=9490 RepID=A0ABQ9VWD0_SAGOE|nr:hypothetical protein P7K49_007134 [Saguinus oedipus]
MKTPNGEGTSSSVFMPYSVIYQGFRARLGKQFTRLCVLGIQFVEQLDSCVCVSLDDIPDSPSSPKVALLPPVLKKVPSDKERDGQSSPQPSPRTFSQEGAALPGLSYLAAQCAGSVTRSDTPHSRKCGAGMDILRASLHQFAPSDLLRLKHSKLIL